MTSELVRWDDQVAVPVHTERDAHLSDRTRQRMADGVAVNTRRAYGRQWDRFVAWCDRTGRVSLPATAETLAEYVTELADHGVPPLRPVLAEQLDDETEPVNRGASPSTIEQAIAAVRTMHRTSGYRGWPDTTAALLVLRDHRRRRAAAGNRPREATPIVVDPLRAMVDTCDPATLKGMRDHVVLVLGVAMAGRRSELVALNLDDLTETNEGLVVLKRASKTDQDAKGREVPIPYGQHADTCPVRVVRAWREALAELGITGGRLLRSVTRHGHVGRSLRPAAIDEIVKARAVAAGLTDADGYSAHSLRAGFATISAAAGHPISAIAEHGDWAKTSPVVIGYVRKVSRWKDNPLHGTGM